MFLPVSTLKPSDLHDRIIMSCVRGLRDKLLLLQISGFEKIRFECLGLLVKSDESPGHPVKVIEEILKYGLNFDLNL